MKLAILYIGKPRDANLNEFCAEFVKRAGRWAKCEMREIAPNRLDWCEKAGSACNVLLDPGGERYDSARFTALVERMEMEGRDLIFVVGGAAGLPAGWKARADVLLSLSPMTFPHELARACLTEQIYRAFTTLRGHPYPR